MQKVLLVAAVIVMAGCSTSYQPDGFLNGGGFSETPLATNIVRVAFDGNGYTSKKAAEDMTMLRSAEVMAQRGYPYFVVVASDNSTRYQAIGGGSSTGEFNGRVDSYTGQVSGTLTTRKSAPTIISKPSTTNTVMGFRTPPTDMGVVYESSFIIENLGPKYKK